MLTNNRATMACFLVMAGMLSPHPCTAEEAKPGEAVSSLTLGRALEMASSQHPSGALSEARVDKAQGDYRQTGLWANPQLEIGAEGITGDVHRASGEDGANESDRPDQEQTVVTLTQPLPIAGGRRNLHRAAGLEVQYQKQLRDISLNELHTQVKRAFLDVMYRQAALRTLEEMVRQLEQIVGITRARVEGGDIAESELLRAEANHSRFLLDVATAKEELETARIVLANAIGCPDEAMGECAGALESETIAPDWSAIESRVAENPRAIASRASKEKSEAELKTEKAKRIPSPNVSMGYRRYRQTGQDTMDVSLGIEVPLFNRNQGRIAAARASVRETEALSQLQSNELRAGIRIARKKCESLVLKQREFKNVILPKMAECLAVSQSAFDAGGNSMIEVLDAYRTFAETRLAYLKTTRDYADVLIDLDALTNETWFKP